MVNGRQAVLELAREIETEAGRLKCRIDAIGSTETGLEYAIALKRCDAALALASYFATVVRGGLGDRLAEYETAVALVCSRCGEPASANGSCPNGPTGRRRHA